MLSRKLTIEQRFRVQLQPEGECLVWTGTRFRQGYGAFSIRGRYVGAHRFAYELANGPIPKGRFTHLHHLCGNKLCCLPAHLVVLSAANHMRHHQTGRHYSYPMCRSGRHALTPENRMRSGSRGCLACRREYTREWAKAQRRK